LYREPWVSKAIVTLERLAMSASRASLDRPRRTLPRWATRRGS